MPERTLNERGTTPNAAAVRTASERDLEAIRRIYNEGIADRVATLDEDPKTAEDIAAWWSAHPVPYAVLVAEDASRVVGWASLNPYSQRCAHRAVADLSIYVARDARGTGVGTRLLAAVDELARAAPFHKVVLFALETNAHGRRLYRKMGYRDVGVFEEHGRLDGSFVNVVAMEKIVARRRLRPEAGASDEVFGGTGG